MTLDAFRSKHSLSLAQLAQRLGLTGPHAIRTVHRYVRHERIPDLFTLRQIEEKTGGAVTIQDWPDRSVVARAA